ncbi:MAG: 30S ribosomal protein S4e [archaeon]|nr:30S ribosomal protein S4e [archaeon]
MSNHLKRLAAPRSWPIEKKSSTWITKQCPGAHSIAESLPTLTVLRDILKVCDTAREAKRIIGNRRLIVDGRPVRSVKTPIGLMDTVSIPLMDVYCRVVLTDKGKLTAVPISKDDALWKLCLIENKTKVKREKIQINLHDGKNILIDENAYKVGDVLKISVPDQKIIELYELRKGASVLVRKGRHAGKVAVVDEYATTNSPSPNIVKFTDGTETIKDNVFVIGNEELAVKLPEVSA